MKKKYITIASIAAVLILGYLNYFAEEEVGEKSDKTIETTDVKYKGEGIDIDAAKQTDNLDTKESLFERAKAVINELILTSDSALLDATKDLILKSNIFAKATNGWSFQSQEIKYNKDTNFIESKSRVEVKNSDLGVEIGGDTFTSDTKMSFINLENNVKIDNGKLIITGDRIRYLNSTKVATLEGNVSIESKELGERYKDKLYGKLSSFSYDLNDRIITSTGPMELSYGKGVFKGEFLQYFEKTDELLFEKNLHLTALDYTVEFQKLEKRENDPLFYISGPVNGKSEKYQLTSKSGIFDAEKNEITLVGNVVITGKEGEKISADRAIYNLDNKVYTIVGESGFAKYSKDKTAFQTKEFTYDENSKILNINKEFTFNSGSSSGRGESLVYDGNQKKATGKNVDVSQGSGGRVLKTKDLEYSYETKILNVIGEFSLESQDKRDSIISNNATYNSETGDFQALEPLSGKLSGRDFTGKTLLFNSKSEKGEIRDGISLIGTDDKMVADSVDITQGENLKLHGNVILEKGDLATTVDAIDYNIKSEIASINEIVNFNSKDKKEKITISYPKFNLGTTLLTGGNFRGVSDKYSAVGNKVEYSTKDGQLKLQGAAEVESGNSKISGTILEYNINSQLAKAQESYKIKDDSITVDGRAGEYNLQSGELKGGNFTLVTNKKDKLVGESFRGNITSGIINIIGKFTGSVDNGGNIVKIESSNGVVNLSPNKKDGNRGISKVTLNSDSKVTNKNILFTSNNIVADFVSKLVTAKNKPVTTMVDSSSGDTVVKSEEIIYNMNLQKGDLLGFVNVENRDKDGKITTATSKRGVVKSNEKTVELIENVVVDSPTATIKADSATYDTVNKKVRAIGNVVVDYKTDKK